MNFLPVRRRRGFTVLAGPLTCGLAAVGVAFAAIWAMAGAGRAVPVELPAVAGAGSEVPAAFPGHVITACRDGRFLMGGSRLPRAELAARLSRLGKLRTAGGERILIRADAGVPFERIAGLLELCRSSGLRLVSFEVTEESAP